MCIFCAEYSTSVLINMYKSEQVVSLSLFFYNNKKKKQQHKVAKQMDKKKSLIQTDLIYKCPALLVPSEWI